MNKDADIIPFGHDGEAEKNEENSDYVKHHKCKYRLTADT